MIGQRTSPRRVAGSARYITKRLIPLALSVLVMTGCGGDPVPTANVYSSGSGTILASGYFNLDAGSAAFVPWDLWWHCIAEDSCELKPWGAAVFCVLNDVDFDAVTRDLVMNAALTGDPITDSFLPAGTVVAYRTNLERYGKFRVDSLYEDPSILAISWVTWHLY